MDKERRLLWLGLALQSLVACLCLGYWHPDEHFQILEWAGFLEGRVTASALSWEYGQHMRSWLLPMMAHTFLRPYHALGFENPFVIESILRLAASALALWTSLRCLKSFAADLSPERLSAARWLILFGCALPFLHARLSSEALATAFFLWALSEREKPFRAGVLMGLTFGLRFQSLLLAGGFLAAVPRSRKAAPWLLRLIAGFALSLAFEAVLDRVGYGTWAFPAWNYVRINIFEGQAAAFGTQPFWHYGRWMLEVLPPFGWLLLAASLLWVWHRPRHALTWALVPFVLVHCVLGHKELRFLTPLFWIAPIWVAATMPPWARWPRVLTYPLLGLNFVYLIGLGFVPARSEISFYRWAWRERPAHLGILGDIPDPFLQAGLPLNFYRPTELVTARIAEPKGLLLSASLEAPAPDCQARFTSAPALMPRWLIERTRLRVMNVWDCGT